LGNQRRDALLDAARERIAQHAELSPHAGATAPQDQVVVLRVLAHRVEPAMQLLKQVWATWRGAAWGLDATAPRLWRT
jgi:urease accessory protein